MRARVRSVSTRRRTSFRRAPSGLRSQTENVRRAERHPGPTATTGSLRSRDGDRPRPQRSLPHRHPPGPWSPTQPSPDPPGRLPAAAHTLHSSGSDRAGAKVSFAESLLVSPGMHWKGCLVLRHRCTQPARPSRRQVRCTTQASRDRLAQDHDDAPRIRLPSAGRIAHKSALLEDSAAARVSTSPGRRTDYVEERLHISVDRHSADAVTHTGRMSASGSASRVALTETTSLQHAIASRRSRPPERRP